MVPQDKKSPHLLVRDVQEAARGVRIPWEQILDFLVSQRKGGELEGQVQEYL